jgi:hypothetical protein
MTERHAMSELRAEKLLAALQSHGVDFVVIGGFALAPHGYVRGTKDLDIVPEPTAANRSRLAAALVDLRARPQLGDLGPEELGIVPDRDGLALGGNWVLETKWGRLDVMQTIPGLRDYARLRAHALSVELPDVPDPVLSAGFDDLVAMKSAAGRDLDIADIDALRRARGERD